MTDPCIAIVRQRTYFEPEEICGNDAIPGLDYCEDHDPDLAEQIAEEHAEYLRDEGLI